MEKRRKYKDFVRLLLVIAVLIILGYFFLALGQETLINGQIVNEKIEAWPFFGPLVLVGIIVLEVVVAPIPGGFISVLSGYIFGPFVGGIYAWIGNVLGSSLAFFLSRKFGKPVMNHFVSQKEQKKYSNLLQKNKHSLFLLYAVPVFPIDVISFLVGLTHISFRRFLSIAAVGFLVHVFVLTLFGDYLFSAPHWVLWVIAFFTVFIMGMMHVFKKHNSTRL